MAVRIPPFPLPEMLRAPRPSAIGRDIAYASRVRPELTRASGGLVMGGAAIAAIGCFLPWIGETPPEVDIVTRAIFSSAYHASLPGVDGTVITGLALVGVLLGLLMWTGRMARGAAVAALVLAIVAAVTVVADYLDLNGSVEILRTTYFHLVQVGVGVYVTGLGVVIWTIGAAVGHLVGIRAAVRE